jgi:UDP-glucose 4-epimerase
MMARWLVTGGCGFIGSHLVDALVERRDEVRVLDDLSTGDAARLPANVDLIVGTVAEPQTVANAMDGVDGVFHLAAVASVQRCNEDWLNSHRTNLGGTIAVLAAAKRAAPGRLPVVYASSAAVYGDSRNLPLGEDCATSPLSAYGVDKLAGEAHAKIGWSVHGVPSVGLRFFNVYGPRQDPASPYSGVIAIFAHRLARRMDISIYGDGEQTRDFIFVGDVVEHVLAAMRHAHAGAHVFNVCTGRATSVRQLADLIGEIVGQRPHISFLPQRPGEIRVSLGDPTHARANLGITASTALLDGLKRTLER